ncbi:MAG TPA: ABC transporter permease [Gemmatimonadaceae bacterium]|nr:ABC transporter permease [Gemmatimonadaceae bacterium]
MTRPSRVVWLLRNLLHRDSLERELDAEVRAYADLLADEKVRAGMMPDAARRAAELELGGREQVKEEVRDVLAGASLDLVARDVKYGWRSLHRNPGFTVAAVLALALGIGAATAMMSVMNSVLLRPLSYAEADRLVVLSHGGGGSVAPANFDDWRRQSHAFADVAAAEYWTPTLGGSNEPEGINALHVTSRMFPMLGVQPLLGRFFTDDEDQAGRGAVVVIGYGLWQRRFGGEPNVVGRRAILDGIEYTIVGVMPRQFQFAPFWATHAELWAPLALGPRLVDRNGSSLRIFARLRDGVSLAQARGDLRAVAERLERQYPGSNRNVTVTPLMDLVVGDVRTPLVMLVVAVGFVLLISCANVAHMLLARAAARHRELAVRCALGASRGRVMRQLLIESLMLAVLGAAVGLLLAFWGVHALAAAAPRFLPRASTISLDGPVLLATVILTGLTAAGFGLMPALRASAVDLARAFKEGGRGSSGSRGRLRSVLVGSEISLALLLLVGAGLLARSFVALRRVDPGFEPRGVMTMTLSITGTREAEPGIRTGFYQDVLSRVRALPNVSAAGMINHVPIAGDNWGLPFSVEGRAKPRPGESPSAIYRVTLPGYFNAMRVPLRRGRDFADADNTSAPAVVIINERMATSLWPGVDPIGRRISFDDSSWVTVVGVAKNVVTSSVAAPAEMELYLPYLQDAGYRQDMKKHHTYFSLVARAQCRAGAACDAEALLKPIAAIVHSIDRSIAVGDPTTMADALESATADTRFYVILLGVFAAVALTLAGLGIFGVIHYLVAQRTREIGIRVALGAESGRVVRLVVREGMQVALAGAAVGIVGALLLTRLIAGMLYGIGATDGVTFVANLGLLLAVAAVASYIPARQATRIDPLRALRAD